MLIFLGMFQRSTLMHSCKNAAQIVRCVLDGKAKIKSTVPITIKDTLTAKLILDNFDLYGGDLKKLCADLTSVEIHITSWQNNHPTEWKEIFQTVLQLSFSVRKKAA